MTSSEHIYFDPTRIIKEGYLTKSPPLSEETFIRKRYRMRWFVLCKVGVEPTLFYFKDEKCRKQAKPKGRISLVGVEVFKQRSKVNGYPHVINVQTDDRLFHLCSTQKEVHEEWLDKLREHHIPNTEINRTSSCGSCSCGGRPSNLLTTTTCVSVDDILAEVSAAEQHTTGKKCTGNDYNHEEQFEEGLYDCPYASRMTGKTTGRPKEIVHGKSSLRVPSVDWEECVSKSRSLDNRNCRRRSDDSYEHTKVQNLRKVYEESWSDRVPVSDREADTLLEDEGGEECYVTMGEANNEEQEHCYMTMEEAREAQEAQEASTVTQRPVIITKTPDVCESEDEGIGRSDSDSSGTSSKSSSISKKLFEDAMRMSVYENTFNDSLLGRGFVGPRLLSVSRTNKLSRTGSLDNLLEC